MKPPIKAIKKIIKFCHSKNRLIVTDVSYRNFVKVAF